MASQRAISNKFSIPCSAQWSLIDLNFYSLNFLLFAIDSTIICFSRVFNTFLISIYKRIYVHLLDIHQINRKNTPEHISKHSFKHGGQFSLVEVGQRWLSAYLLHYITLVAMMFVSQNATFVCCYYYVCIHGILALFILLVWQFYNTKEQNETIMLVLIT